MESRFFFKGKKTDSEKKRLRLSPLSETKVSRAKFFSRKIIFSVHL
jgi:hypothetical protein